MCNIAVRTGYLAANWLGPLGGLALRVLLPMLLFRSLSQSAITQTVDVLYLTAYAAGSLAVFALGWAFGPGDPALRMAAVIFAGR